MRLLRKLLGPLLLAALALLPSMASAQAVIAHRGVFHDVNGPESLPENSYWALIRAYSLGLQGAELDLRLDAQNNVAVTHDLISNRTTILDGNGGTMNAVDVALNIQKAPAPIFWSDLQPAQWGNLTLKAYGRNGVLIKPATDNAVVSLSKMLTTLKNSRPDIISSNFKIILDIQDYRIMQRAAITVKQLGLQKNVYLKFFASKALNSASYKWAGSYSCFTYARDNDFGGLNIIPQINDGELDIYDNNDRGVWAFGRTLSIEDYLGCWRDATKYTNGPKMAYISVSVPADDAKATAGAWKAINWAAANDLGTMTIIPNPDAARVISGKCRLFSFQSAKPGAVTFNEAARQAKSTFAGQIRPDYIIWDVMGDVKAKKWATEYQNYIKALC